MSDRDTTFISGIPVIETKDLNLRDFPADIEIEEFALHRRGTPSTKHCRSCGEKLVRRFAKLEIAPEGHEVLVYDYVCEQYSKWNPLTWFHSGKTPDWEEGA